MEVGIIWIGPGGGHYGRSKTGKRSVDWCSLIGYGGGHYLDCLWRLTLFGLAMQVGIIGFWLWRWALFGLLVEG